MARAPGSRARWPPRTAGCTAWGGRVGGLYGVAIGKVFFGESMFARASDASKVALVHGVALLRERRFELIDCQVASAHTMSLGASNVSRSEFLRLLAKLCDPVGPPRLWS
jgi:leucyl/phenylalanyl-tRNA--protein transferase